MEITIGVSGDKGSSRQQIHSLGEKYLKLSGAGGFFQLRCVADVPQEGWLEAGMWIWRKTGNTEPGCLFSLFVWAEFGSQHHFREVPSSRISLCVTHLLSSESRGKRNLWHLKSGNGKNILSCGDQDPWWLGLCSVVWAQTLLSQHREAKLCQFWAVQGTWPADESI